MKIKFLCHKTAVLLLLISLTQTALLWSAPKKKNTESPSQAVLVFEKDIAGGALTNVENRALLELKAFKDNEERFYQVMDRAKSKIEQKKYIEAMDEYFDTSSGKNPMELSKETFRRERNSPSIIPQVEESVKKAKEASESVKKIANEAKSTKEKLLQSISSSDVSSMLYAWNSFKNTYSRYAEYREEAMDAGKAVLALYDNSKRAGIIDASYLFSTAKMILGFDNDVKTGLVGAMDCYFNEAVTDVKMAAYEKALLLSKDFTQALEGIELWVYSENHEKAKKSLKSALPYGKVAFNANALYDLIHDRYGEAKLETRFSAFNKAMGSFVDLCSSASQMLDGCRIISDEQKKIDTLQSPSDPVSAFRSGNETYSLALRNGANTILSTGREITNTRAKWVSKYAPIENASLYWDSLFKSYEKACNEVKSQTDSSTALSVKIFKSIATWYGNSGKLLVEDNLKALEKSISLIPEELTIESDPTVQTGPSYPKEALENTEKILSNIEGDTLILQDSQKYLSDPSLSLYQSNFTNSLNSLKQSIADLEDVKKQAEKLEERAKILYNRSAQAKMDGDREFKNAQNDFYGKKYDSALLALEKAASFYDESLRFQTDKNVQSIRDTEILEFSEKIVQAKFELVVKDVRKLKNDAESAYYSANFERALACLNRAENLWKDVSVDEDPELVTLQVLVNTALSMNEGRVLSPSFSNYPEMSQILSLANKDFEKGKELIGEGKTDEGKAVLSKAKETLRYLQRSYPLNQEANLLVLKIEQETDPQSFKNNFSARVEELKKIDYSKKDTAVTAAYHDLQDLLAINPDYPGLKSLVDKAESSLNLKRNVESATSQRAQVLANEAKKMLNQAGKDSGKLEEARKKANEALKIDSANSTAKAVLDEIQIRSGNRDSGILSAEDEKLYQQANFYYRNNYILRANEIMTKLWENPSNRKSTKIEKLKRWIDKAL